MLSDPFDMEHILSREQYDFSAKYMASCRLNERIRENPASVSSETVDILETLYRSPGVRAQTQAYRWLLASVGYGWYLYTDRGGALVTAPPVHQFTLGIQLNFKRIGLKGSVFAEVFGPMDLEKVYGPGYNAQPGTDLEGWLDTANADLSSPKRTHSPWYGVVNLRLEQRIYKGLSAFFGIDNVFDYHQVKIESPLYYPADADGNPTNADVTYIWGPLRGRFIYGGLRLEL